MRRKFLAISAIALSGVICWLMETSQEPTYGGIKLSECLLELQGLAPDWDSKTNLASVAIRQIGTNAVPVLLNMLSTQDSRFKQICNKVLERQSLIQFRFQSAETMRLLAQRGLLSLGPLAEPAIPMLESSLVTNGYGEEARVLIAIGSKGIPALERALKQPNRDLRLKVIRGLWESGDPLQEACPLLVWTIQNEADRDLRIWAAIVLARTGTEAELVVPLLLEGLADDREDDTRAEAARALVHYPQQAKEHMSLLKRLAKDRDIIAHRGALDALQQIAPEATTAIGI